MPRFVWWVTAVLALQLVAWALIAPQREGPDESTHLDLALHLAEGHRYPEHDELHLSDGIVAFDLLSTLQVVGTGSDRRTAENAPARSDRPTFDELGGNQRDPSTRFNQMPQHPPLYYASAAVVLRVQRALFGDQALEKEAVALRLANSLLLLPLPALAWSAARRLRFSRTAGMAAAAMFTAIPQLHHLGAVVSNDPSLVLASAVAATLVASTVADGPDRRRDLKLGVVVGLALLVKGFAFLLLGWVLLCYGALALWARPWRGRSLVGAATVSATAAVVGGWWWLQNFLEHGEAAPTVALTYFPERPGFDPDLLDWGGTAVEVLATSFWGYFGWLIAPLPLAVVAAMTLLGSVLLVLALRRPFGDHPGLARHPVRRRLLVVYLAIVPVLAVYVLRTSWEIYSLAGRTQFLQGRYFYAGLVPLVVVGAAGAVVAVGRWAPFATISTAVLMTLLGWHAASSEWWGGAGPALGAIDAWNPVADGAATVTVGLLVVAVVGAARSAWPAGSDPADLSGFGG